jgi:hypothetical protein
MRNWDSENTRPVLKYVIHFFRNKTAGGSRLAVILINGKTHALCFIIIQQFTTQKGPES